MTYLKIKTFKYLLFILITFNSFIYSFSQEENLREDAKNTVVIITDGGISKGAGIILGIKNDRMYICTAMHIISEISEEKLSAYLRPYPGELFKVSKIFADDNLDLAILVLKGLKQNHIEFNLEYLSVLSLRKPIPQSISLYSIGSPGGEFWDMAASPGHISDYRGVEIRYQTNFVEPGLSGGALFGKHPSKKKLALLGMILELDPPHAMALKIETILEFCQRHNIPLSLSESPDIPDVGDFTIALNSIEYKKNHYNINLGKIAERQKYNFQLFLKNKSKFDHLIELSESFGELTVLFQNSKKGILIHSEKTVRIDIKINGVKKGNINSEIKIISSKNKIFAITLKYIGSPETVTVQRSSGPKISGNKKNYSAPYSLCLGPSPEGYTLIKNSAQHWLTGDRSCGSWAHCTWGERSDNNVCFIFSLQGHDEGRPYARHSEGHLKAVYRLKPSNPRIE